MYFYYLSDIAIAIFYHVMFIQDEEKKSKEAQSTLKQLLKGYKLEHSIHIPNLSNLPLFLKFREIILYLVIIQNSENDIGEWGRKVQEIYRPRIVHNIPFVEKI